ncbi:MAG: hypothetical protein J6N92_02385 [Alloprevotella sp.]|nr:hypothetical protein [Alloprevotella sp.]
MPPASVSASNSITQTTYYDAALRPVQTIQHEAGVSHTALADLRRYDGAGRLQKYYLPQIAYSEGAFCAESEFDNASAAETCISYGYEPSSLSREISMTGEHTAQYSSTTQYIYSSSRPIYQYVWTVPYQLENKGAYTKPLSGIRQTDEDGLCIEVFQDAYGRLLLERRFSSEAGEAPLDTYYVYDDFGSLVAVLPPLACSSLYDVGTYNINSESALKKYGYFYLYDGKGQCKGKRLPGQAWHYYVHDRSGREILSQSPRQHARGEWTFHAYDVYGRPTRTGIVSPAQSQASLISTFSDEVLIDSYSGSGQLGYTASHTLLDASTTLQAFYYDNYDYLNLSMFSSVSGNTVSGAAAATGLQTGRYVARLQGDGVGAGGEVEACYYDLRGRIIKSFRSNSVSGVAETMTCSYNNINQPVVLTSLYSFSGGTVTDRQQYTYHPQNGHHLRTVQRIQLTNSDTSLTRNYVLAQNTYDDLARLRKQVRFGAMASTFSYDTRGRLQSLSSGMFCETLHRGEVASQSFGTYYRNGRISSIDTRQRAHQYTTDLLYDGLGRYSACEIECENTSELCEYDAMGNLTRLQRNIGSKQERQTFTLNGNRISRLSLRQTGTGIPSVNQAHSYTYDADGNETSYSSGNVSVHYNLLSLPDSVESSIFAGRIRMAYMADGRRMLTQTQTSQTQLLLPMTATAASTQSSNPRYTTTEVRDGDLVFRDGRLVRLYTEGGYYSLWNDTLQSAWVRPYAYVQDHLGSVRLVIDATSRDTVQSLEYLPTGKIWRSAHAAFQPFKFCGKEALTQNAWDVYDSLARFQRMDYPRFTSPDPLAEKYYGVSPYVYSSNDPINRIDPLGLSDYYNLNGKNVRHIDDGIDRKYLLFTNSSRDKVVNQAIEDMMYIYIPGIEILTKLEKMFDSTEENKKEYYFAVGEKGSISDIHEGLEENVPKEAIENAIEDLIKLGDTYMYDVHSHPFDESFRSISDRPSIKDYQSSQGRTHLLLVYKIDEPHNYGSYLNFAPEKKVYKAVIIYNVKNNQKYMSDSHYSSFARAIKRMFK